jgi:hypothetical protein
MDQQPIAFPPVEIYLHSKDSVNSTDYNNDCSFQFERPLIAPNGYSMYLQCLSFTMPNVFHVVNEYNNHITINNYNYTLAIGNYSIFQLVGVLTGLDPNVKCTYDGITLKVTFTSEANITLDGPLCLLLGISANSSGTLISSKYTVDMSGTNSIYILTDLSSSNSNIDSRAGSDSVLCRVPVTTPAGSIIRYIDFNGRAGLLLDDDVINSIRVVLEDEMRMPLLATLDWQLTLQVRFLYTGRQRMQVNQPVSLRVPPA